MANAKTIQVNLKAVADISDVTSNVKQIQTALSGLTLPKGLESQFTKIFGNVEKNAEKASNALATGFKTKGDVTAYEKATNLIVEDMKKISQLLGQIDTSKLDFEVDASKSKALLADIKQLRQEIDAIRSQNLAQLQQLVNNKPSGAKAWQDFFDAFQRGDDGIEDAQKALNRLQTELTKAQAAGKDFSAGSHWDIYKQGVETCAQALQILEGKTGVAAVKQNELNQKTQELNNLQQQANATGTAWLQNLTSGYQKVIPEAENYVRAQQKGASSTAQLNSELEQFKSKITYFFGMNNAVNLFQRAVRSAYETIQDLDAVMSETAVVTDFDISDMWEQLPEYTERANQLGVSIQDVYESMTIFYQQGLDTNEAVALSNETLKMARIAGLDAAEATDRMTNALRGFNMELNETNAQRVNDVYNKLAAISASDVDEISTAMTKVASLANSANMEFETTSAFLAQMIETTRESAETAGTALKTVVARFSEVKSLYSEGELLGTDSEGEEIDVNKVSTALRTAGINLNEYLTGAKGLDDIFIELAEKWDSLDIVQQRYIATMAAGSRQQSRFIAMMSDYERTMELVDAANNSAGSANEMYEKTLESLETKLNQLANAWNTFLMSIANSDVVKLVVDALTGLITAINKLTGVLPGALSGIAKLGVVFGGLKIGKSVFNKLFADIGTAFRGGGEKAGQEFGKGVNGIFSKLNNVINTEASTQALQRYNDAVQNSAYQSTLAQQAILNGESIQATQIALDKELAISEAEKASATQLYAQANQLSIEQASVALMLESQGIAQDMALAAAKAGLTRQKILDYQAQMIANGATEEEVATRTAAIVATYANTKATNTETSAENMNFLTGMKVLATKLGLVAQSWLHTSGLIAETAAQWSLNTAMLVGLGIIGLIIAAVILLIAGIVALINAIQNSTPEAKLEAAEEAAEDAAEAAEHATDAFNTLSDSFDSLSDKYSALDDLTQGTQEWKEAVQEVNSEILDLIQDYSELASLVENKGGVLTIDIDSSEAQAVLDKYQDNMLQASSASIVAQQKVIEAQTKVNFSNLSDFWDTQGSQAGNWVSTGDSTYWSGNQEATEDIATKIYEGQLRTAEEIQAYAKSIGVQIATTEDDIEALRNFGSQLAQANTQTEAYYTAMAANAIALAEIDDEVSNYASNFLTADRMAELKEEALANADDITKDNRDDKRDEYAQLTGYDDYDAYMEDHDEDISDEDLKVGLAAAQATQDAADAVKTFTQNLNKLSDSAQKIYKKSEGGALTQADINNLTGSDATSIAGKTSEEIATTYDAKIQEEWNQLDTNAQAVFGTYESFAQDYANAVLLAANFYSNALETINSVSSNLNLEALNNLDASSFANFSDNLLNVISSSGEEAAQKIIDDYAEITKNMDDEDAEKFASALNSIDWKDADAIDEFNTLLGDLGVQVDKNSDIYQQFINDLKTGAKAIRTIDIDSLTEQVQSLSSILKDIKADPNNRTFSEEDYESLIAAEADLADQFVRNLDGEYVYIGSTMETLTGAIIDNTSALLGETESQLENRIDAADLVETFAERFAWSDGSKANLGERGSWESDAFATNARGYLSAYIGEAVKQGIDLSQLGIAGLSNTTTMSSLTDTDVSRILDALYQVLLDKDTNQTNLNTVQNQGKSLSAQTNDPLANASLAQTSGDPTTYANALIAQAEAAGVADSALKNYYATMSQGDAASAAYALNQLGMITQTYQEAAAWEQDKDQLDAFAKQLMATNPMLAENQALAYDAALANMNLNTGLANLVDNYEDWCGVLWKAADQTEELSKTTPEYVEALSELKQICKQMFNTTVDLADSFYDSAENMDLLEQAALGDFDAINQLREAASEAILETVKAELDDADLIQAVNDLAAWIAENPLPNLEAGATLDDSAYIASLNEMIAATGMGAEQIRSYLGTLGYNATITTETTEAISGSYTSGGNINYSTHQSAANNNKGGGSSSSGGGSGGSSDTSKSWENPYDELYNLTEKINENLRERESLERKYDRLLKSRTATSKVLIRASLDEIANLEKEADLQRQLLSSRERQLANIGSEKYQDDEGNISTFSQLGVTKYASYDTSTGLITIDWNAIDSVTDEDTGAAIEAYISKLEELSESYEEAADRLDEIEDEVAEIRDQGKEDYLELEERIYDAIVEQEQKIIDGYSELNDTITDTNSDIIDSLQDSIDLERQIRDNTEKEEDIADKEQRLAYLQRDTSGANALEILQLQEEIEDARQDYQDSLIDQAIDQLSKDNDLAADQRAKQIELMQAQLDYNESNGAYWDQVNELLRGAFNADGTLNNNSALIQLLEESEAFSGLSYFGKKNWINEMATTWLQAQEGFSNWMVEDAEDTGSVTLSDGTKLTYKDGKWYDKSGNEWQDLSYDMQTGQYSATKVEKVVETPTTPTTPTVSTGREITQDIKNGVSGAIWNGNQGWGTGSTRSSRLTEVFGPNNGIQSLVNQRVGINMSPSSTTAYSYANMKAINWKKYAEGGIADFTGPAWLDGTKSKPEMVLSAADTQNFIQLKNILAQLLQGAQGINSTGGGDNYFDISIAADIGSDYDVDKLAERIKKQIADDSMYRNVNTINWIR